MANRRPKPIIRVDIYKTSKGHWEIVYYLLRRSVPLRLWIPSGEGASVYRVVLCLPTDIIALKLTESGEYNCVQWGCETDSSRGHNDLFIILKLLALEEGPALCANNTTSVHL